MFKKILYAIIVIVIIIILAIMWTDSKKADVNPTSVETNNDVVTTEEPSINDEINSIQVDSSIDADLNAVDADIKTL